MTTSKGLIFMLVGVLTLSLGLRSGSPRAVADDLFLYVGLVVSAIGFLYVLVGMYRADRRRGRERKQEIASGGRGRGVK